YMNVTSVLRDLSSRYDIRSEQLWIEVQEKAVLSDQKRLVSELERVRREGFPIIIDDFGRGDSALSVLTEVRVDAVRLDREVVAEAERAEGEDRLLEAITTLAEVLKIRVFTKGGRIEALPVRTFEKQYLNQS
ncbi:MAG: EAL domain-containing protein, partial [Lachnospiraceae bacterium]|nr:EAL domain-containing protein [Lachnospiraceae bacterium]